MTQYVLESSSRQVQLSATPLSDRGAAGIIHKHPLNPNFCIKIYRTPALAAEHEVKVRSMIKNQPDNVFEDIGSVRIAQLAWPVEAVLSSGKFAGFVMPFIDMSRTVSIDSLMRPLLRRTKGLPEHLYFRLVICTNIARMLRSIHLKGYRMIDVKPANISAYGWDPAKSHKGAGCIALLDCDGFGVSDTQGRSMRGQFASDDYILPTALKASGGFDSDLLNKQGIEQDTFAFAVMAFQLLNEGLLPIDSKPKNGIQLPTTNLESWRTLRRDVYAFSRTPAKNVGAPDNSLHYWMSDKLLDMFEKTFLSPTNPAALKEWVEELERLSAERQRCRKDATHWKLSDKDCGQCNLTSTDRQKAMPVWFRGTAAPKTTDKDLRAAVRTATRRGLATGIAAGIGVAASGFFGLQGAAPYWYALAVVMLFWLSGDAFAKAPVIKLRQPKSRLERLTARVQAYGGHTVVAGLSAGAVLLLSPIATSFIRASTDPSGSNGPATAELPHDPFTFSVYQVDTPRIVYAKGAGANLREEPFADESIAVLGRTSGRARLNITGYVDQADGLWYQILLDDGQTAYIRASLTETVDPSADPYASTGEVPETGALNEQQDYTAMGGPADSWTTDDETRVWAREEARSQTAEVTPGYNSRVGPDSGAYPAAPVPAPAVLEAALISGNPPKMPRRALERGKSGSVTIKFTVLEDGSTTNFRTLAETPSGWGFSDAAITALKRWNYLPKTIDGRPVQTEIEQPFEFAVDAP